ncbi:MAG: efflux transporter outer membrane subunit [Burkholderiales bacterium]|nr:efflux transporter outer membrane subunit [Burkholderiales bacterium]MDE2610896.1 efflux transporter outer membrane subunit [Burkholderiales bacterium]
MQATYPNMPRLRTLSMVCIAIAVLGLSGCANYMGIHSDKHIASPNAYATARSLPNQGGQWPTTDWAAQFGDPQLQQLIHEALAGNPDLQMAQARLAAARSQVEGAGAALLPRIGVSGDVYRQKFTEHTIYPPGYGGSWFTQGDAMANLTYELDLWGKNRAAQAQAISAEKAEEAADQEARLTVATAVARAYNQLAQQYALRDVLMRELKQREMLSHLARDRLKAGLDTEVETKQAQGNIADAKTQLSQLDGQILVTRHQLGALLGKGPDRGLQIARPRLATIASPRIPDNLPLNLLGRRPDIVAARWQVEAALKGVDVAKARFYPDINLMATIGFSSFGLGQLFTAASQQIQAGPAISLPIFDGGRLRANLKGEYARYEEAVASYDKTLNDALTDVADRLSNIHSTDQQLVTQAQAYDAAKSAYDLAVSRYKAGLAPQLVVLNAESFLLAQEQLRANLVATRRDQQMALIKAMGGGFDAQAAGLAQSSSSVAQAAPPAPAIH